MKLSLPIYFLSFFFPLVWSLSISAGFLKDYAPSAGYPPDSAMEQIIVCLLNETYDIHVQGEFINESVKCSPDRYFKMRVDFIYQIQNSYLTDAFNNSYILGKDYAIVDDYHFSINSPNITFDFWIRNLTFREFYPEYYPYGDSLFYGIHLELYPTSSSTNLLASTIYAFTYTFSSNYPTGKNFKKSTSLCKTKLF